MTKEWTIWLISIANQKVQQLLGALSLSLIYLYSYIRGVLFSRFWTKPRYYPVGASSHRTRQWEKKWRRGRNRQSPCMYLARVNIRNMAHLVKLYAQSSQESTWGGAYSFLPQTFYLLKLTDMKSEHALQVRDIGSQWTILLVKTAKHLTIFSLPFWSSAMGLHIAREEKWVWN